MKLTTLIAAAFIALPAYADETITQEKYCVAMAELAESVMGARQRGISLRQALEIAEEVEVPFASKMVIMAYEYPRFSTDDYQAEAILDFGTDIHLKCLSIDGEM